jgi:Protein of unknown function (DUF1706)
LDRQKLVKQLDKAWATFKESYAGLSESQLTQPGVTGNWSVKDIIAHVTGWEEEALKHLPLIIEGGRPPRYSTKYGGIDAFNAQMTEQRQGFLLSKVLRQMDETHRRLVTYVQSLPEQQFTRETRVRRRLRLDTYSHYPKHAKAIREWRERLGWAGFEEAADSVCDEGTLPSPKENNHGRCSRMGCAPGAQIFQGADIPASELPPHAITIARASWRHVGSRPN